MAVPHHRKNVPEQESISYKKGVRSSSAFGIVHASPYLSLSWLSANQQGTLFGGPPMKDGALLLFVQQPAVFVRRCASELVACRGRK